MFIHIYTRTSGWKRRHVVPFNGRFRDWLRLRLQASDTIAWSTQWSCQLDKIIRNYVSVETSRPTRVCVLIWRGRAYQYVRKSVFIVIKWSDDCLEVNKSMTLSFTKWTYQFGARYIYVEELHRSDSSEIQIYCLSIQRSCSRSGAVACSAFHCVSALYMATAEIRIRRKIAQWYPSWGRCFYLRGSKKTVPAAVRSEASVCGRLLPGLVGWNPTGSMDACL